ncbi:hypothetical protein D3C80_1979530 [compost metagenome]
MVQLPQCGIQRQSFVPRSRMTGNVGLQQPENGGFFAFAMVQGLRRFFTQGPHRLFVSIKLSVPMFYPFRQTVILS